MQRTLTITVEQSEPRLSITAVGRVEKMSGRLEEKLIWQKCLWVHWVYKLARTQQWTSCILPHKHFIPLVTFSTIQ